jgi:hypothetical protein
VLVSTVTTNASLCVADATGRIGAKPGDQRAQGIDQPRPMAEVEPNRLRRRLPATAEIGASQLGTILVRQRVLVEGAPLSQPKDLTAVNQCEPYHGDANAQPQAF